MIFGKKFYLFFLLIFLTSCTRELNDSSKLTIHLPESGKSIENKITQVGSQSVSQWNAALNPLSFSDINCFSVFVGGPEAELSANSCLDSSGDIKFKFGPAIIFVPQEASSLQLDVPSGANRRIIVVGNQSQNGACETQTTGGGSPDFNNLSEPYILAEKVTNLSPGRQDVTVSAVLDANNKFSECSFLNNVVDLSPQWLSTSASQNMLASSNINTASYSNLSFLTPDVSSGQSSFSFNPLNPDQITIEQPGDYFFALNLPLTSSNEASSIRAAVRGDLLKNGVEVPGMLGMSTYLRNSNNHGETSIHFAGMLPNLTAGDVLSIRTKGFLNNTTPLDIDSKALVFAEKISGDKLVFAAEASATTAGTDLNSVVESALEWQSIRHTSGFTHNNAVNPQEVQLNDPGLYMVYKNVPLFYPSATANRVSIKGQLKLDGLMIPGGYFEQGYLRGFISGDTHDYSSLHWFGLVETASASQSLTVTLQRALTGANSINIPPGQKAHIYIEKLNSTDNIISLRGNDLDSGTNWNPLSASKIQWAVQDIIDSSVFSHSTVVGSENIQVNQDGDYFLVYSDALTSVGQRVSPRIGVLVNGTIVNGAKTKTHYIRAIDGHDRSSATMALLLNNLSAGDIISIEVTQEASAGTVDDLHDARLVLIKK